MTFIPLDRAYVCLEPTCQVVTFGPKCELCGSAALMLLSDKIGGKVPQPTAQIVHRPPLLGFRGAFRRLR